MNCEHLNEDMDKLCTIWNGESWSIDIYLKVFSKCTKKVASKFQWTNMTAPQTKLLLSPMPMSCTYTYVNLYSYFIRLFITYFISVVKIHVNYFHQETYILFTTHCISFMISANSFLSFEIVNIIHTHTYYILYVNNVMKD